MLNGYHISVYTSDAGGNMWFAGGPTTHLHPDPRAADDWKSPLPLGFLWGSFGKTDSVPSGPNTQIVIDDGKPCACYNKSFEHTIGRVNSNDIFYHPLGQNSNSLAGTMLRDAGGDVPDTWPYWTPGYSMDLNHYIPLNPFSGMPYPIK
jgi:hypothetical protein